LTQTIEALPPAVLNHSFLSSSAWARAAQLVL